MSGPSLVVFDVDGTLVDSQREIVATVGAAFAGCGRPRPAPATILSVVGLSLPVAMARLAPEAEPAEHARLADAYRAYHLAARAAGDAEAATPLYPGARETLEALAARSDTLLGIATGKGRPGLDHLLARHGLGGYFVTLQTADGHPSKPHPSMLAAALAETGCAAERAVMIGDTDFDVAMGRAAGYATVGVAWGYHPVERLETAGADRIVADFAALARALDDLLGPAP